MKKLLLLGIICAFSAQLYAMNSFRRSANCAYQGARNKFQSAKTTFNKKRYEFNKYLDSSANLTKRDIGVGAAAFVPAGVGYYAAHPHSDYDKYMKAYKRYKYATTDEYATKHKFYDREEKKIMDLEAELLFANLSLWQKIKAIYNR